MVGIVLVSHSRPLAIAVQKMVLAMTGPALSLAIAAGAGDDHADLGTNAFEIQEAIQSVLGDEGVVILVDMGSALLSAETALSMFGEEEQKRIRISSAPFIEGAVAAGVIANAGGTLQQVMEEAVRGLEQKKQHLDGEMKAAVVPVAMEKVSAGPFILIQVDTLHGLHARPAARLVKEASRFSSDIRVTNVTTQKGPASARSLSAIAALEVLQGQTMEVTAHGPDAEAALQAIQASIASEKNSSPLSSSLPNGKTASHSALPIVAGIAIGPAFYTEAALPKVPQNKITDVSAEKRRFQQAVTLSRAELLTEQKSVASALGSAEAEIFSAQALILDDPAVIEKTKTAIETEKWNAAAAWKKSFQALFEQYEHFQDEYLRSRAADILDVGRRVLRALGCSQESMLPSQPSVLIVDNLIPSQAANLTEETVLGVICLDGGATSHAAILLRGLGIPSVVQARALFAGKKPKVIGLNGGTGEIWLDPDSSLQNRLHAEQAQAQATRDQEIKEAELPAVTLDGYRVEILANAGSVDDVRKAVRAHAEGVGLLRTEFLFLSRATAPSEEEQYVALRPILEAGEGRPIIVRTLDAGGDKELAYLNMPPEANPFLGVRALRISLHHPELFQPQLRSLLRVGIGCDLRILLPMVSGLRELREARAALQQAHESLEKERVNHLWPVPLGIMIEIPSAAILADALAVEADFFSIGTNDLTQYTLAADRGNAELSVFQDALHPAVLSLIQNVITAAHQQKKKVAVCGEAAGDPIAALVLIGLGIDELSMAPSSIPRVKKALRAVRRADLEKIVAQFRSLGSAEKIRAEIIRLC